MSNKTKDNKEEFKSNERKQIELFKDKKFLI